MRLELKEAGLQNSVLTNRNRIRGISAWVSNHIFAKPKVYQNGIYVDTAGIEGKKMQLPGEGSIVTGWQNGAVSRGHSTSGIEPYQSGGLTRRKD